MTVAIYETIVVPTLGGVSVRLHISDAPKDSEDATFELTLLAKLPDFEAAALAQLQREALEIAGNEISNQLRRLATEIQEGGLDQKPRQKVGKTPQIPESL